MDFASTTPNGHLAFRFLTEEWPERARMAAIQDIYARAICRFEFEPCPDSPLFGEAQLRTMPGLGLADVRSSRATVTRHSQHMAADELLFTVWLEGAVRCTHRGREIELKPGDAMLTLGAERGAMDFMPSRLMVLRLPVSDIAMRVPDLEDRAARLIPRDNDALRLLVGYAGVLREADGASPDARRLAVTHLHDLVAHCLGAASDASPGAGAGVRAARLRAIKADIAENIVSADLSVTSVAARHRLPLRYVQRLFEDEGTSFTGYVLEQRLARAHRMLVNPQLARLKISTVAMESGFNGISHFNEAFRRRYGASPSDIRAQGRRDR